MGRHCRSSRQASSGSNGNLRVLGKVRAHTSNVLRALLCFSVCRTADCRSRTAALNLRVGRTTHTPMRTHDRRLQCTCAAAEHGVCYLHVNESEHCMACKRSVPCIHNEYARAHKKHKQMSNTDYARLAAHNARQRASHTESWPQAEMETCATRRCCADSGDKRDARPLCRKAALTKRRQVEHSGHMVHSILACWW